MRISDWSSDVCSSDLIARDLDRGHGVHALVRMLEIPIFAERFADFHALDPGQFAQQRRSILRREMPTSEQQPERLAKNTDPAPRAVTGADLPIEVIDHDLIGLLHPQNRPILHRNTTYALS